MEDGSESEGGCDGKPSILLHYYHIWTYDPRFYSLQAVAMENPETTAKELRARMVALCALDTFVIASSSLLNDKLGKVILLFLWQVALTDPKCPCRGWGWRQDSALQCGWGWG